MPALILRGTDRGRHFYTVAMRAHDLPAGLRDNILPSPINRVVQAPPTFAWHGKLMNCLGERALRPSY